MNLAALIRRAEWCRHEAMRLEADNYAYLKGYGPRIGALKAEARDIERQVEKFKQREAAE